MSNDLTIEMLPNYIRNMYAFPEQNKDMINLCEQLLAVMQREAKLRGAIKGIQAIRGEDDFLVYRECEQALASE